MPENSKANTQEKFADILTQIHFDDPSEIAKKETGLKIAREVNRLQMGSPANGTSGFFTDRAAKFKILEDWSLGKQDMTQFLPEMGIDNANKSYAKIDMTPPMIGAQFVATKVESIAKNTEYPCVTAIDDASVAEKKKRYEDAIFRMKNLETIISVHEESGVQLEDPFAYIPSNEQSAKVYFQLQDKLPKEIRFEEFLANSLDKNNYDRVIKPEMLRDGVVFNMECTFIEKVLGTTFSMERVMPKTLFYNFFSSSNGGAELSHIGRVYNLKIGEARKKWGSQNVEGGLTEKELFEFARKSTQNNPIPTSGFNHSFTPQFSEFMRKTPWDDNSCFVIDFEIKINESDYYVSKVDNYGKENITPKNGVPKPVSEKSAILKKSKDRWYRCVYSPFADMIIYWGKPDLTILDYSNEEQSFCSYSINIPNNNGEFAPSLFARALEPFKTICLTKLKQKLLIGRLSPAQYDIDVHAAKDVIDGNGKAYDWEEILTIKQSTGVGLWSSKGHDPLTPGRPTFTQAASDPTLANIIGLQDVIDRKEAEIRVLLGTPIYLDGSDVGQRTAARLAEGQTAGSFNVTGFIPNGHNQVMEETLHKLCILRWQEIVTGDKESGDDLINTRFRVSIKMKMNDYEKQKLEKRIDMWSSTMGADGKPIISPKDAFMIEEIPNYKLASMYMADVILESEKRADKKKKDDVDYNAKLQQESNDQAAKKAIDLQKDKLDTEKEIKEFESNNKKQEILLEKGLELWTKILTPKTGANGESVKTEKPQIPQSLETLLNQTFENISITLYQDKKILSNQTEAQEQMEQQSAEEQIMQEQMAKEEQPEMQ